MARRDVKPANALWEHNHAQVDPEDFDQIVAEAIERCVQQALKSGLDGQALRAFARSRIVAVFGPAWKDARRWIIERSYGRSDAADGDVEGTLADVIVKRVAERRTSAS